MLSAHKPTGQVNILGIQLQVPLMHVGYELQMEPFRQVIYGSPTTSNASSQDIYAVAPYWSPFGIAALPLAGVGSPHSAVNEKST